MLFRTSFPTRCRDRDRRPLSERSRPEFDAVMTVTIPQPSDGVRIVRIAAPREVPPATRIRIAVDVDAGLARSAGRRIAWRVGGIDSRMVYAPVDEGGRALARVARRRARSARPPTLRVTATTRAPGRRTRIERRGRRGSAAHAPDCRRVASMHVRRGRPPSSAARSKPIRDSRSRA